MGRSRFNGGCKFGWGKWKIYQMIYARDQVLLFTEKELPVHQKWGFPLRISSVNVAKSAVSCGFGHIHWRSP